MSEDIQNDGIGETKRKLASIQVISNIRAIPEADSIVVANVLGWECIIKKGEYKEGELVIYFEVDSILPERSEFEFMRERKFRVKTIKLRKQISQGLVMPLSIIKEEMIPNKEGLSVKAFPKLKEGDDVTELLGVTKFDLQAKAERDALLALQNQIKKTKMPRWLMDIGVFRYIYFKLNPQQKGNWPNWIEKTDEQRLQTCAKRLMQHYDEVWYVTEKLDGQSATFFTYRKRIWGILRKLFGVGSREVWRKSEDNSSYWSIARQCNIKKIMMGYNEDMIIQGEIIGPGIQKNKYKRLDYEFYVFNVLKNGVKYSLDKMERFTSDNNLKMVPIVRDIFIPSQVFGINDVSQIVKELVEISKGTSTLFNCKREGLVFRLADDPNVSFKVINPEFSLAEDKDE